ncbi:MAG TPA: selenocysteine-specific translation elongation factor [Acetobacteraceae bacterium]|nr:selenocysteine-specific translation elongation factor [Acetobacteraceae bacterium]
MIIGTAGHIDHGKTALVKALTGIDADRLAEEKRRGITIDLGFAYTDTSRGTFGFVDVPGHERFVHTMLAGATGIDAALLVVALNDGVMPQTREHAAILDLLGIDRGIVALTKADIAGDNLSMVEAEVRTLLAATALHDAAILPVSAVSGEGIAALVAALDTLGPKQRDASGHPRLAVDRAFTLAGAGLIVTGTLVAGRMALDDRLMLSPPGLELRVRGLHAQNRAATVAEAGQRVALNIAGPRLSKDAVTRGDWVLHPDIHTPTASLDARLRVLGDEPAALRADTPVHLHLGAAHVMARVHPLDRDRVPPGEDAFVRLALDRPIGALAGDRLVLRDAGATRTIGGGSVIDPFPPTRGRRTPARLAQLLALQPAAADNALRQLLALPPGWTDRARFLCARNLPANAAEPVLAAAPAVTVADLLMAPATRDALHQELLQTLAAWHAGAPDQPGLQPERLRQQLTLRPPVSAFRAILDGLLRRGTVRQDGPWLRLSTHQIRLSAADERLWPSIRVQLAAERFRPPRARDLAKTLALPEPVMRAVLKRLQRVGHLLELAPDHFFLRETVAEMASIAAEAARADPSGELTAATFRDRLDNGRKVAIQILEFFDRVGVTARSGDTRRVREDRLGMFGPVDAHTDASA